MNYKKVRFMGKLYAKHQVVVAQALGRFLRKPECIHHWDEDKSNWAPSNLVVCPDAAYHALLHTRMAALEATGNPNLRKCFGCQQYDEPSKMYAKQNPGGYTYRHTTCNNLYRKQSTINTGKVR